MTDDIHSEIHRDLPIGGPGRDRFTKKAFHMLPEMDRPRILDAGCGHSGPTMTLARLSGGLVAGLDVRLQDLEALVKKSDEAGLASRVAVVQGSMVEMPFLERSFDVIWAEGSIHAVGLERGLLDWRRYLKTPGFVVIHEMAWLRPDPPQEIVNRWTGSFSEINTVSEYLELIPRCGYEVIGQFTLPDDWWWNDYYSPLEQRIRELRSKYDGHPDALQVLDAEQREADLYKKCQKWYGSAYLVMEQK